VDGGAAHGLLAAAGGHVDPLGGAVLLLDARRGRRVVQQRRVVPLDVGGAAAVVPIVGHAQRGGHVRRRGRPVLLGVGVRHGVCCPRPRASRQPLRRRRRGERCRAGARMAPSALRCGGASLLLDGGRSACLHLGSGGAHVGMGGAFSHEPRQRNSMCRCVGVSMQCLATCRRGPWWSWAVVGRPPDGWGGGGAVLALSLSRERTLLARKAKFGGRRRRFPQHCIA